MDADEAAGTPMSQVPVASPAEAEAKLASEVWPRDDVIVGNEEACALLQCSPARLRQLIARGDIPAVQAGKAYVIPRQAFCEAINALANKEAQRRAAAANTYLRPPSTLLTGPNRRRGRPPKVR